MDSCQSAARATRAAIMIACAICAPAGAQTLTPPSPTATVKASYPPEALARHREGSVSVVATVGKDGVVSAVEIGESSGDSALDRAAADAALQWRFLPALQNGAPIESQVRIPFHFHLAEPESAAPSPGPLTPSPQPRPSLTTPSYESNVRGKNLPPGRGASDYHVDVEKLSLVPRSNAAELLKLAPGILLTNEGGEGHAEQIFLRGFDAREAQDLEVSADGVPVNESGNLHGNGYADTHFIIPELVESLRVVEGPFDPRQGNYAVAGSAEYHLGLSQRGITAKFSLGSFGSYRMLLTWAPPGGSPGTFAAVELYQTAGFGQNRDGQRANVMAQYQGRHGGVDLRVIAQAYLARFHTAGVLRDDDFRAGRVGFYDSYDRNQGEDASRYSLAVELAGRSGQIALQNLVFAVARPLTLREDFTGFLLDTQEPEQTPHGQRGDLIDMNMMEWTVGARGHARLSGVLFKQVQELEIGYFARGDFVTAVQQRDYASGVANHPPYKTEKDLDSRLGDIGLYADANLRFLSWLSLRGGVRSDLFTYDVNNLCANQMVDRPSAANPPDQSCFQQITLGAHVEPNLHSSTAAFAILPRASLLLGPRWGIGASASAGQGVRSIDPDLVADGSAPAFANITAYEGGLTYEHRFAHGIDLAARAVVFDTKVDRELIFSQAQGRNALCGGSTRIGNANSLRLSGPFFDLSANFTYVRATFDADTTCSDQTLKTQSGALVPYVPDLVFRADAVVRGDLPWWLGKLHGHPLRAGIGVGATYVGPRPLPFGDRSDTIFTLDASVFAGWRWLDFTLSAQNLLDSQYRLGEYNYVSDFHSQPYPTLVPERHFSAGAPRTVLFSIAVNYGGNK